jgi:hypothetical protein
VRWQGFCVEVDVERGDVVTMTVRLAGGDQSAMVIACVDGQNLDVLADDGAAAGVVGVMGRRSRILLVSCSSSL